MRASGELILGNNPRHNREGKAGRASLPSPSPQPPGGARMSVDQDTCQGLVLRAVIVESGRSVRVLPYNRHGRLDAFVFEDRVGVFIKYSTRTESPWRFTFHIEQVSELLDMEVEYPSAFAVFVCGADGVATIDLATLHDLVSFRETEQAWLRIERQPRSLYSIAGNRAELRSKVPRGVSPIIAALSP